MREKGIGEQVINAAIRQIFIGSALQFPYVEPDYFHELVYQRNPELKELNEGILKWFIDSATKTQSPPWPPARRAYASESASRLNLIKKLRQTKTGTSGTPALIKQVWAREKK